MFQIPTLYTNYQELLLDLDILGKILRESNINKDDLKAMLFEEYKLSHPLPTLEDKRYELSDIVSSDYHITYANDIELASNEVLVDLGGTSIYEQVPQLSEIIVPSELRQCNNVTDEVRNQIVSKFVSKKEAEEMERVFNTVEDKSIKLGDSEEVYTEDYEVVEDKSVGYSDSIEDTEVEDDYSYDEQDESSEDDESYSDDYDIDEDNYDNEQESYIVDDEDEQQEEVEEYDIDDDYDSGEVYESEEENDEGYDVDNNNEEEYDIDDYGTEDSNESVEEGSSYGTEEVTNINQVPTPVEMHVKNEERTSHSNVEQVETIINKEEPKDLRDFIRKHPRCEISFALQYFSRKEIEKYLMMGKIIKKGTKLHI